MPSSSIACATYCTARVALGVLQIIAVLSANATLCSCCALSCNKTGMQQDLEIQTPSPLLQLPFIVDDQKAPVDEDELATHATVGGMGPPYPVLHCAEHTLPRGELEQLVGKRPLTRVFGGTPGHTVLGKSKRHQSISLISHRSKCSMHETW